MTEFFVIVIGLYIAKQIIERKERKKKIYIPKRKRNKTYIKQQTKQNINPYIEKTNINLDNLFNETKKEQKTNYQKGKEYELQVGKHFEKQGYYVIYNGINKKEKDEGIDLIAIKENEIILIQCKNWKKKIKQHIARAFLGDCQLFLAKHPEYQNKKIRRLIVIPDKILDKATYAYIKNNQNILNFQIIQYQESS